MYARTFDCVPESTCQQSLINWSVDQSRVIIFFGRDFGKKKNEIIYIDVLLILWFSYVSRQSPVPLRNAGNNNKTVSPFSVYCSTVPSNHLPITVFVNIYTLILYGSFHFDNIALRYIFPHIGIRPWVDVLIVITYYLITISIYTGEKCIYVTNAYRWEMQIGDKCI